MIKTKTFWQNISNKGIYNSADMTNDNREELDEAIKVLIRQKDNQVRNLWVFGSATGSREMLFVNKVKLKVKNSIFVNDFVPDFVENARKLFNSKKSFKDKVFTAKGSATEIISKIKLDINDTLMMIGVYKAESFLESGYETYKKNVPILGVEKKKTIGNIFSKKKSDCPTIQFESKTGFFSTWYSKEDLLEMIKQLGESFRFIEIPKGYLIFNIPKHVTNLSLMLNNVFGNMLVPEQKKFLKEVSNKKYHLLYGTPEYYEKIKKIDLGKEVMDFLFLNLPPICNLRCKKCSIAVRQRVMSNSLTFEEYKKIIDEASELGAKTVAIAGEGEPLIYPKFKELIEHANKRKMAVVFATNGTLLNDNWISFLEKHDVGFTISLDVISENKYQNVCGSPANFRKVMDAIKKVKSKFNKKIKHINNYVVHYAGVYSVVSDHNIKDVKMISSFVNDKMFHAAGPINYIGNAKKYKKLFKTEEINPLVLDEAEFFLLTETCPINGKDVCGFMYYGLSIGYNGEILLADHCLASEYKIGNIKDNSVMYYRNKVKNLLEKFYDEFGGTNFCIARDPKCNEFIKKCLK